MKSLYLRIYATVVVVLLLFALVSGWIVERHLDDERARNEQVASDRLGAWAELLGNSLPGADTSVEVQLAAAARLVAAPARAARARRRPGPADRRLRIVRAAQCSTASGRSRSSSTTAARCGRCVPACARAAARARRAGAARRAGPAAKSAAAGGVAAAVADAVPGLPRSAGLAIVLVVLFLAIAAGAYPVVRRLTRRLEALKQRRRAVRRRRARPSGRDLGCRRGGRGRGELQRRRGARRGARPVASLAARQRQPRAALAAGAHEDGRVDARRGDARANATRLKREIDKNVAELDGLVEEVLLASRLDVAENPLHHDRVDLLAVAAEEAARVGAHVEGTRQRRTSTATSGCCAAPSATCSRTRSATAAARSRSSSATSRCRRPRRRRSRSATAAPAFPRRMRERIFEPFFRLPGHAEQAGGVGLGLALVKQIAEPPRRQRSLRGARGRRQPLRDRPAGDRSHGSLAPQPPRRRARSARARCARSRRSLASSKPHMPRPAVVRPSVAIAQKPRAPCIHAGLMPARSNAAR